jgi:hypothetical protein
MRTERATRQAHAQVAKNFCFFLQKRRFFFSEEKKQKTFVLCAGSAGPACAWVGIVVIIAS